MYGIILLCMRDMVLQRFGENTWDHICKKAKVDDKFFSFQEYSDDVFNRLVVVAADMLGLDTDGVLELVGVFWVKFVMQNGYDKLIRTLGKNLSEFIGNLDFMHGVYMKTMYPKMKEPSFRVDKREDGSLTVHYFSERRRLHALVSGIIKGVARIIFHERIEMDVIDFKEDNHRGIRIDHWVFHVRFGESNLPPIVIEAAISKEDLLFIPAENKKDSTTKKLPDILKKDHHNTEQAAAKFPEKIMVDPVTFCQAFPYHIVFDKNLTILHCGVQIQRICPRVATEGALLDDFLTVNHPRIELTIDNLRSFISSIFIAEFKKEELANDLKDKSTITLRGQMIWMDSEQTMLFLCSPCLTKLEDLTERGLHLSDIAPHDLTRDLILFHQQRIAEVELSRQLEHKKEELSMLMKDMEKEKKKTDTLLYSMLPREVANDLREGRNVKAGEFPQVTVLFSDIVHFTDMSSQCAPIEIVELLNDMYTKFDHLTNICGVYKVETIGDAYMAVGGLPVEDDAHAQRVAQFGLQQLRAAQHIISPTSGEPIQIRVGIHSGPVVAGVVGLKMPRYCLFGDTVNTASRMESTGLPGKVHTSEAVLRAVKDTDKFVFTARGDIEVKGKGKMKTYFLYETQKDADDNIVTMKCPNEDRPRINVLPSSSDNLVSQKQVNNSQGCPATSENTSLSDQCTTDDDSFEIQNGGESVARETRLSKICALL